MDEAARPRGILKHKSSLSSDGQASAAAAAAAAVKEAAAQEQAEQAAAAAGDDAPLAAAGFEAILAADIVGEAAPAELAPRAAPEPAVPAPEPPTSQLQETKQQAQQQAQQAGSHAAEVYDAASPVPPGNAEALKLIAAATAAAEKAPTVETAAALSAAAAPMDAAAGEPPAPAGAAAQAEAGQEQEPLSPRPVELTPGPSLSRGQKMLARLGTPLAAGKLQLLAGTDMGRKVTGASPLFAARTSIGGVAAPPRRAGGRMSRGERLLAVAKGSNTAAASPAPAGQASEGAPEEGPTLARAAAVLL